jgi:HAD superfamily hydrolase (TIGR01509 family)
MKVFPRALVFDFDGLIVDTETPIVEAWVRVHERAGVVYARDHALSIVGHADVAFDPWIAFDAAVDRGALENEHRALHQELLLAQPILPGVLALLDEAQARGLPVGVASNSPRSWVEHHLKRIGLFHRFHALRCRDEVARGKPEPDVYLAAAAALEVTPREAVAFEDSLPGSEAAHRAGFFCVVAPNPSTRHHAFPHAHLRVESLAAVSLATLQHTVGRDRREPPGVATPLS